MKVGDGDVVQIGVGRGATVAGRHEHGLPLGGGLELQGQRVLAPAVADDENLHSEISALWNTACVSSSSSITSSSFCMRWASSPVNSIVFSARIVTSATSGFSPAASSAALTASNSGGAHSTSIAPSSS